MNSTTPASGSLAELAELTELAEPAEPAESVPGADGIAAGIEITERARDLSRDTLTPDLLELVARLHRAFDPERRLLLAARDERQAAWDLGRPIGPVGHPLAERVRGDWQIQPLPADLRRRRVEITGPISSPKMVIHMLSRTADGNRADCAMLDFEDSMKPSWSNVVAGLRNLIGAVDGSLSVETSKKTYRLRVDDRPLIMVRCRGLHLDEVNLQIDGQPVCGGLLELAACAFHTARALLEQGRTPKFYIPKVEHYREARWWNDLLTALEAELDLDTGALRTTLLIETLPAAFQIEEILYELRSRIAGLNVGRWDKIFSDIKVSMLQPDRILADRATITMHKPWMKAYAQTLIHACHRHGAFAMGGMAAFTPGSTEEARTEQTAKVVADKRWEAELGHDGCWVSHPYFIGPALEAFKAVFDHDNQLDVIPEQPDPSELLPIGEGPRTEAGLRTNIRVGIAYIEGWRRNLGCVAWDGLMEDLATLEISRAQTWQWLHHGVRLDDGPVVSREHVASLFAEELEAILDEIGSHSGQRAESFIAAAAEAQSLYCEDRFRTFLTTTSEPVTQLHDESNGA